MQPTGNPRTTLGAFLALSAVWGASFLFMKIGLEGLEPGQIVITRIMLGAATLTVIMLVTRRRWPRDCTVWLHMIVVGGFFCAIPFTLFTWAEQFVPSSLASIYNAATPVMTLLLTPLVLASERLGRRQLIGLYVGIIGVVMLMGPWQLIGSPDLAVTLPAQLACIGAALSYGFAGLYVRRFVSHGPYDAIQLSAVQLTVASGIVLLLSPITARGPISLNPRIVLGMLALGVLGTGFAYVWFNLIIRSWGAARASTVTYVEPVVGVVLGLLLLGERISWYEPVGGLIVIAGVVASQGRLPVPRRRERMPAATAAEPCASTQAEGDAVT